MFGSRSQSRQLRVELWLIEAGDSLSRIRSKQTTFRSLSQGKIAALGAAQAEQGSMTLFVYVNTAKQVGDKDTTSRSSTADAAEK
jgi:hypothetical protein